MKLPARRSRVPALERAAPVVRRWSSLALGCGILLLPAVARADLPGDGIPITRSFTGQFVVSSVAQFSPLFYRRNFADNTNFVRLEPTLLAIGAERFRELLWQHVGLKPDGPWRGKIYLVLEAAHSPDDEVTITSSVILQDWDYRVVLPDILTRTRYARALSAVVLLEVANRDNPAQNRSAEVPSWLVDGLAQQVVDEDAAKVILSTPSGIVNNEPLTSLTQKDHGIDALASARQTLHNANALTFNQLSWPTDEQINGDDGGVYLASAQLFTHELQRLPGGPARLHTFLAQLPFCQNWQTAFFQAFHDDFQRPLDVEKWWSLRTVDFAAHNAGSLWTVADTSDRLDNLLSVPVQLRDNSNSLPTYSQISLQDTIRDFDPARRDSILESRLRDLEIAQFRVATPFAVLVAGYRDALADFLGDNKTSRVTIVRKPAPGGGPVRASVKVTLKKLDALDARRRDMNNRMVLRLAR